MPNVSTHSRIFSIRRRTVEFLPHLTIFESKPFTSSSPSSPVPTHQHISHLILDQKSPSEALQTFRWATKLPSFTHNQSTYRALIYKLCSFRRFDDVHKVLDEMPNSIGSPPDEDVFVTVVRGLGRAQRIKEVIRVPDLVAKYNVKPSLKIYNTILDVLVKEDIDIAREFYRKKIMDCGVKADDYTFGILMKGLCLTNRIGDGFKLLQAMKSRGVPPNAVVYNTLLQALCKKGKVGRARSLMNEMPETNDVTYNLMISAYCKEENLVQSLVLLEKSLGSGFVPDAVTVTKIVELLCKVGRVDEAVEVMERVEVRGCRIDVVAYNTLIRGFCDLGRAKIAARYLKEMEMKGCLPNVNTYNALISGFCEIGMLGVALDLFNDMKTDGISWNFDTYDIVIKALCSKGRVEDGIKILELMELSKGGSGGRITPYNSIIYGLYLKNRQEEALEFLSRMERLFPRAVDRSLKILGFCEERSVENAKKVYDQMIRESGIPCVLVYAGLIHVLSQKYYVREAFELMNQMISCKYYPVLSTYNSLIHGFCSQGKVTNAHKLMGDMIVRGCLPDAETYCSVIDALCRKGDLHKALIVFYQMVDMGIIPKKDTWSSLLLHLSHETSWLGAGILSSLNKQIQGIIDASYG